MTPLAIFFDINIKSEGYGDIGRVYSAIKVAPFGYEITVQLLLHCQLLLPCCKRLFLITSLTGAGILSILAAPSFGLHPCQKNLSYSIFKILFMQYPILHRLR